MNLTDTEQSDYINANYIDVSFFDSITHNSKWVITQYKIFWSFEEKECKVGIDITYKIHKHLYGPGFYLFFTFSGS